MPQSKGRRNNYEAMFLVSPAVAADLGALVEHIESVFSRAEADIISMKKWDERRLAYEIDKNKRGVYILAYFSCDPVNIETIERLCGLSEQILRVLMLRADHLTLDEMKAADGREALADEAKLRRETQAKEAEAEAAAAASAEAGA